MLQPGDHIDRFQVEAVLGEGGLAKVYLVRHRTLGARMALKVLMVRGSAIGRRLLREGRIQANLSHPHIVAVHDVIEHDGYTALVMEYVEGVTLAGLLGRSGALPEADALALFGQLLSGVIAAHDLGVLHRDLKPANVLISATTMGTVAKITDFGIARIWDGAPGDTVQGDLIGTPGYMAPEQVSDPTAVDVRADIYSLGALLYCMVTGRPPFLPAARWTDTLDAAQRADFPPVRSLAPELSPRLAALIERCLQPDPDARPADGRALAAAIWGEGSPTAAAVSGAQAPPGGLELGAPLSRPTLAPAGLTEHVRTPTPSGAAAASREELSRPLAPTALPTLAPSTQVEAAGAPPAPPAEAPSAPPSAQTPAPTPTPTPTPTPSPAPAAAAQVAAPPPEPAGPPPTAPPRSGTSIAGYGVLVLVLIGLGLGAARWFADPPAAPPPAPTAAAPAPTTASPAPRPADADPVPASADPVPASADPGSRSASATATPPAPAPTAAAASGAAPTRAPAPSEAPRPAPSATSGAATPASPAPAPSPPPSAAPAPSTAPSEAQPASAAPSAAPAPSPEPAAAASAAPPPVTAAAVSGTFAGKWQGRPVTITLSPRAAGRVAGRVLLTQGPTVRTLDFSGALQADGRLVLQEPEEGWTLTATYADGVLSGMITQPDSRKPAGFTARRQ